MGLIRKVTSSKASPQVCCIRQKHSGYESEGSDQISREKHKGGMARQCEMPRPNTSCKTPSGNRQRAVTSLDNRQSGKGQVMNCVACEGLLQSDNRLTAQQTRGERIQGHVTGQKHVVH